MVGHCSKQEYQLGHHIAERIDLALKLQSFGVLSPKQSLKIVSEL